MPPHLSNLYLRRPLPRALFRSTTSFGRATISDLQRRSPGPQPPLIGPAARSISKTVPLDPSRTPQPAISPAARPSATWAETSTLTSRELAGASGAPHPPFDTAGVPGKIPSGAVTFGAAGLLPYAGTSVATVYLARAVSLGGDGVFDPPGIAMEWLQHVEVLQLQYGALILSFLGAIHWGLEFALFNGTRHNARYLLGIAPVLSGWISLLLPSPMGLVTQFITFGGMWFADVRTTRRGWAPAWYATYRTYLTSVVCSTIAISLAGSTYYATAKRRPGRLVESELAGVGEREV